MFRVQVCACPAHHAAAALPCAPGRAGVRCCLFPPSLFPSLPPPSSPPSPLLPPSLPLPLPFPPSPSLPPPSPSLPPPSAGVYFVSLCPPISFRLTSSLWHRPVSVSATASARHRCVFSVSLPVSSSVSVTVCLSLSFLICLSVRLSPPLLPSVFLSLAVSWTQVRVGNLGHSGPEAW